MKNLRRKLYKLAKKQKRPEQNHQKLVKQYLLQECIMTAVQGWNCSTIIAGKKLKDGKTLTEDDVRKFAEKHNLDFKSCITSYELSFWSEG